MKNITIITLSLLLILMSCTKFEEGPKLSLRTVKSRICGNWEITSYTKGGVDSLFALPYKQIEIGKFYKRRPIIGNFLSSEKYTIASVKSYPEGVDIATVDILANTNKTSLRFYAPRDGNGLQYPAYQSLVWVFFEYPMSTWLGAFDYYSSDFHITKLKNNNMKLTSLDEAFNVVEYEFKKIK